MTAPQPHDLQKRLEDLHLYEEIAEHYAHCEISPQALLEWVADRAAQAPQPVKRSLFAQRTAQVKWDELRDAGYKMDSLQFSRSINAVQSVGSIDAYGKVTWAQPVTQPLTDEQSCSPRIFI